GTSLVSCFLGMFCKESMATAPVMVFLYDVVFCAGSITKAWRQRPAFYAGLAASIVVLAVLLASNGRSHSAGFSSGIDPWTYFVNQAPIVLRYFRLATWPAGQVFDYGLPRATTMLAVLPTPLASLALGGVTGRLWFVDRRLAYLATWVFVTLAPTSSFVPIATEVGAERRMYLPMIAIAVLAVLGLKAVLGSRAQWAGVLAAL